MTALILLALLTNLVAMGFAARTGEPLLVLANAALGGTMLLML